MNLNTLLYKRQSSYAWSSEEPAKQKLKAKLLSFNKPFNFIKV